MVVASTAGDWISGHQRCLQQTSRHHGHQSHQQQSPASFSSHAPCVACQLRQTSIHTSDQWRRTSSRRYRMQDGPSEQQHYQCQFTCQLQAPRASRVFAASSQQFGQSSTPQQRQLQAAEEAPDLQRHVRPRFRGLVIVEGKNDADAVLAALDTRVWYLCGVSRTISPKRLGGLRNVVARLNHMQAVVLMDPDSAGRQGRDALDREFGPRLRHAFIPAADAIALSDIRGHEEGNLGVEHADSQAIVRALKRARKPQEERSEFTRADLSQLGLVTEMDIRAEATSRRAQEMRTMVGQLLGIGRCNAKQLLHQLNRYGFERAEVEAAVAMSRATIFPEQPKPPN